MSVRANASDVMSGKSFDEAADSITRNYDNGVTAMRGNGNRAAQGFQPSHENANHEFSKAIKTSQQMILFGQGNFEAAMKSAQIWAAGWQDLSNQVAVVVQSSFEESVATMKAIPGMKSMREIAELQTGFARAMMENAVTGSSKLTDISLRVTEEAIAPIAARVSFAVEKINNVT